MSIFQKPKGKGIWWIDYYCEGRRKREKIGSKMEARAALEARLTDIRRGDFKLGHVAKARFSDLCERYLTWAKQNKRSWIRDEFMIKELKKHFGEMRLNKIRPVHIEEYKTKRLKGDEGKEIKAIKCSTVNREVACLKHMFNLAIDWDMAGENPMRKLRKLPEQEKEIRQLTKEEVGRLIECVNSKSPHLKSMIILAINTGMRLGEILGLKWSAVDFKQGHITLRKTKSSKPRYIPMNRDVVKLLSGISRESEFVFPSRRLQGHCRYVKTAFWTACERAGLDGLTFHSLRHHAATLMLRNGASIVAVQKILGHSSLSITQRYLHDIPLDLEKAVGLLENQVDQKMGTIWTPGKQGRGTIHLESMTYEGNIN